MSYTAIIHPMMVHFPIALVVVGFFFSLVSRFLSYKWISIYAEVSLYLGTLTALGAAVAGDLFTPHFIDPVLAQAKSIHSVSAGMSIALLCITSVLYIAARWLPKYQALLRTMGFILYALSLISIAVTGYLGGVLVYNDLLKFQK